MIRTKAPYRFFEPRARFSGVAAKSSCGRRLLAFNLNNTERHIMASFAISWRILMHSLMMLIRNAGTMFKIFTVPFLLTIVLVIAIFVQVQGDAMFQLYLGNFGAAIGPILMILLFIILINLVLIWPIVTWHRFVLLETPVDWINKVEISSIFMYFFGYLGVMILVLIPTLSLYWFLGANATVLLSAFGFFLNFGVSTVMTWIIYRMTPLFPGIALRREGNGLAVAWAATRPGSGALFGLALIFAVFGLLQTGVALVLPEGVFSALSVGITILSSFLHVSIATTIYGVYVEGREI
ncbi:hypothetical protein KMP13_06655 [Epibacterium ulvae]|uniref:hypothetical protein n=1 Tax=Epibacterium ulvae TaxID=1156985 RepID=UPI001BFC719F|nr:hypothetical protein [Epibacterium ulvae]MBT8153582.1 hypothetical protein [Epibacterium ulvae]